MTHWNFSSGAETWGTAGTMAWTGAAGSPSLGCMWRDGGTAPFDYCESIITGISIPVIVGDLLSFRFRLKGTSAEGASGVALSGGAGRIASIAAGDIVFTGGDTGWVYVEGTVTTGGTITTLTMRMGDPSFDSNFTAAYFDSVFAAEIAAEPELRTLKMDADNSSLYLTAIEDNTLTLFTIPLSSLVASGTATFGTAAYTDPDTFTRGLFPVIKPGVDGILYLYGRDGNNKQVWYRDHNGGTLGWQDIGPGTATWGTAKYCVALSPFPLRWDVIAAFDDNDIYRTITGTANWVKAADAPTNLRAASRHPTSLQESLLAGTAAGTLHYTHNVGQSFDVAGGTVIAGTINHIEMSRY